MFHFSKCIVFLYFYISIQCLLYVKCANILWLAGLASPSHQIWNGAIQNALAERGHNITALSVDVNKYSTPNLTFIHIENVYDHLKKKKNNLTNMANNTPLDDIIDLAYFRSDACEPAFKSNGLSQLMEYPKTFKFDLVVHDFAGSHCLLGFVPRFGSPPLVSVSASTCPIGISSPSGNPLYPSIIPSNHLRVGYHMNVLTRIYNSLLYLCDSLVRDFWMCPRQNLLAKKYFGDPNLDVVAISRSSVFTLVNLAPFDVMQPFFQTVIPVGGLQIQKPKPLDQDLDAFMSGAESGVVYFALGTNIKSEDFSRRQVRQFLSAFSKFPHVRFLWKYSPGLMMESIPENVRVRAWMPQNDILADPRTLGFISHAGALSYHEAVWHGVPQLLMPFIIDQKHNAARAAERGIAVTLDKDHLSTEVIVHGLQEVLHNKSYRENVRLLSAAFRDQPLPPLQRAVWHVEHAMHVQARALRAPAQDVPTLQLLAVDVWIILGTCSIIFIIISFKVFKFLSNLFKVKNVKKKIS